MSKKLTKQNLREKFCDWLVSGEGKLVSTTDYEKVSDFFYSQIGQEECCEKCNLTKNDIVRIVGKNGPANDCEHVFPSHQTERKVPEKIPENLMDKMATRDTYLAEKINEIISFLTPPSIDGKYEVNHEKRQIVFTPPRGEEEHDREWCRNCMFRGANICNGKIKLYDSEIKADCPCKCHSDLKPSPQPRGEEETWENELIETLVGQKERSSPPQPRENWEEKFDEKFGQFSFGRRNKEIDEIIVKKFISSLLASEKERIAKEVENWQGENLGLIAKMQAIHLIKQ